MRVLLVANAGSGTASRRAWTDELVAGLKARGIEVERREPGSAGEARDVAAAARRSTHDVLVAAGGDGTLNAVVNGLVRTSLDQRPALTVLPTGRGNDFAAEIGIRDAGDTLDAVAGEKRRFIDLGKSDAGVFLGVAGAGFDAQTARRARQTPILSGSLLYSYAVLRTLADLRHLDARVRYDGGAYEGPVTFAAVGNSRRYGGGMRIAPRADLTDGLLDLCLVKDISRRTLVYMFPTVFAGRHLAHPKVAYVQTRFVEIETAEPAELYADGEPFGETPARIEAVPAALELFVPRSDP